MTKFENVNLIKQANIYFDGKVTSRTAVFQDGTKKTYIWQVEVRDDKGELVSVISVTNLILEKKA